MTHVEDKIAWHQAKIEKLLEAIAYHRLKKKELEKEMEGII